MSVFGYSLPYVLIENCTFQSAVWMHLFDCMDLAVNHCTFDMVTFSDLQVTSTTSIAAPDFFKFNKSTLLILLFLYLSIWFMLTCSVLSLQSAEASLKHLGPGYFLGKVCFMVTNGMEMERTSNTLILYLLLIWYSVFCYMSN